MDPTGENDIPQHMYRQSMIISLFGSIVEPPEPSDARNLDILVDSVCMYMYVYNRMYHFARLDQRERR